MTIRDKIITHVGGSPPFPTTHAELADLIGASPQGVVLAISQLMAAGKIRIAGMDGRKRIYEVVQCTTTERVN
jgi:hypothetical protein